MSDETNSNPTAAPEPTSKRTFPKPLAIDWARAMEMRLAGETWQTIGRALGREAEAATALQAAEADKSAFCLENDTIGSALLAYLHQAGQFTGTAAELKPHLVEIDPDLDGKWSAKRIGKRISAIWPHLQKALAKCAKETSRTSITHYTFRPAAGFAGF